MLMIFWVDVGQKLKLLLRAEVLKTANFILRPGTEENLCCLPGSPDIKGVSAQAYSRFGVYYVVI